MTHFRGHNEKNRQANKLSFRHRCFCRRVTGQERFYGTGEEFQKWFLQLHFPGLCEPPVFSEGGVVAFVARVCLRNDVTPAKFHKKITFAFAPKYTLLFENCKDLDIMVTETSLILIRFIIFYSTNGNDSVELMNWEKCGSGQSLNIMEGLKNEVSDHWI